jgi:hypothetical protein
MNECNRSGTMLNHGYALDRLAADRAEELRRLAAVNRIAGESPSLPRVRHAAGRLLLGLGRRLSDTHTARQVNAL